MMGPDLRRHNISIVLLLGAQLLWIGSIFLERHAVLSTGKEIRAKAEAYDPRDLLRGDFVRVRFSFNQIGSNDDRQLADSGKYPLPGKDYYVVIEKNYAPDWVVRYISETRPEKLERGQMFLRGRIRYFSARSRYVWPGAELVYGIENFFVAEGSGRELEQTFLAGKVVAVLAVGSSGEVMIKKLTSNGSEIYRESLF